jgi:hypothetical protein
MLAAAIDDSCHGLAIDVVEASSDQGKALVLEILYFRRKLRTPIEPWPDSVLIGGSYVQKMVSHKRPDVIRNQGLCDRFALSMPEA